MGAFLRFTLFVAALCLAAVLGYAAGVRNADRGAMSPGRMTIDTGDTAESGNARRATQEPVAPEPPAANDAAQDAGAKAADDGGATSRESDAPTSIDEILQRQASQPPSAN
jgi:hypothetical protein